MYQRRCHELVRRQQLCVQARAASPRPRVHTAPGATLYASSRSALGRDSARVLAVGDGTSRRAVVRGVDVGLSKICGLRRWIRGLGNAAAQPREVDLGGARRHLPGGHTRRTSLHRPLVQVCLPAQLQVPTGIPCPERAAAVNRVMATPMGVSVIDEGQPGVPWTFQICEPATRPYEQS